MSAGSPPTLSRARAPWVVLGGLTAVQIGIGVWRAATMFGEGLRAGVSPLGWSTGLAAELLLCGALAFLAWWWLPAGRTWRAAAWALRFLVLAWTLALCHFAWALVTGTMAPWLSWPVLALAAAAGVWIRRAPDAGPSPADAGASAPGPRSPAVWIAAAFFLAQIPHLVFPYHFTDAHDIWACRAFAFAQRGALTGVFDCLDPARPPLQSVLLWLGIGDPTFQGRLLPLLLFGAFVLVFYHLARRVAPSLAPWALVWLLATDHVFKGQVSAYAGVPLMLAIGVAIALATDDGTLVGHRGLALAMGAVAGAAVALIRRDGVPEFFVAMALLMWVAGRRDARLWVPLVGAAAGVLSWVVRPAVLHSPALFAPSLATHWTAASAVQAMARLAYGAQGQVFSHYGYGAFAWSWLIVAVWARRAAAVTGPAADGDLARRFGLAGIAGWGTTLALYAGLTFVGQPQMSSLFVIRTGFGRHLVHFFPFCLLHATAAAERLLRRATS